MSSNKYEGKTSGRSRLTELDTFKPKLELLKVDFDFKILKLDTI
jgi:hypothetical protein